MLWGRGIGSPQHLVYGISASLRYIVTMQCPYCDHNSTKVVDTRESSEKVRRRRECLECERRFTTYETAERLDIKVKKKGGKVEEFDENKIREGVSKAIKKTSIDEDEIECILEDVKKAVRGEKEIKAEEIGEAVKQALKERDEVAYIRFASVYDSFEDVESFREEVEALKNS